MITGSLAIRYRTHGFASPPYSGFALIGLTSDLNYTSSLIILQALLNNLQYRLLWGSSGFFNTSNSFMILFNSTGVEFQELR